MFSEIIEIFMNSEKYDKARNKSKSIKQKKLID